MKNKYPTVEEIAEQLRSMLIEVKTIEQEIIDLLISKFNSFAASQREMKSAANDMAIRDGKIGFYFLQDARNADCINVEISISRFIKTSIEEAWCMERPESFVVSAREMARQLTSAANKVERSIKPKQPEPNTPPV